MDTYNTHLVMLQIGLDGSSRDAGKRSVGHWACIVDSGRIVHQGPGEQRGVPAGPRIDTLVEHHHKSERFVGSSFDAWVPGVACHCCIGGVPFGAAAGILVVVEVLDNSEKLSAGKDERHAAGRDVDAVDVVDAVGSAEVVHAALEEAVS